MTRVFHWNVSYPLIIGVLNVTPDSFSDGGKYVDLDQAIAHAETMARAGADIIDVGGESSRPGAAPVSAEEELRRVLPVIERLSAAPAYRRQPKPTPDPSQEGNCGSTLPFGEAGSGFTISVDTTKAVV